MLLRPPPSIALGMMLIAACPAGNMSNFLTHMAGGNTALSISLSAISTSAAVVLTPLVTTMWGSLNPATAPILREMHVDAPKMLGTVLLIMGAPLVAGRLFATRWPEAAGRAKRPVKAISVVFFVGFVAVALRLNFDYFVKYVGAVAAIVAVQDGLALATGYAAARALRLPERDARAIAIECGIRNSGLGLVLIFGFFAGLGGMAIIAAWWGVWHVVSGLALAAWWSKRPAAEGVLA
jgi:BASS family bile acid:Na+ symporter